MQLLLALTFQCEGYRVVRNSVGVPDLVATRKDPPVGYAIEVKTGERKISLSPRDIHGMVSTGHVPIIALLIFPDPQSHLLFLGGRAKTSRRLNDPTLVEAVARLQSIAREVGLGVTTVRKARALRRVGRRLVSSLGLVFLMLFSTAGSLSAEAVLAPQASSAFSAMYTVSPVGEAPASLVLRLGGQIVEEYGSFYLVRGPPEFGGTATESGLDVTDLPDFHDVAVNGRRIDILETPSWNEPFSTPENVILRMKGPIKAEWLDSLRNRGIVVSEYLPNFAFLAHIPTRESLVGLDFLTWSGRFEPEHKIVGFDEDEVADPTALLEIRITPFQAADSAAVGLAVQDLGAAVRKVSSRGLGQVLATASAQHVLRLAQDSRIRAIEPWSLPEPANTNATWVVQSETFQPYDRPIFNHTLLGGGQVIAVSDDGVMTDHPVIHDSSVPTCPPDCTGHRKILAYFVPGDAPGDMVGGESPLAWQPQCLQCEH